MVFDYIHPITQGISTAIVLVRVEMGLTYVDNKTSNTVIRFAASSNDDIPLH
jgi:hypothetical protein